MEVVLLANEYRQQGVVGIDFSGNPLLVDTSNPSSARDNQSLMLLSPYQGKF